MSEDEEKVKRMSGVKIALVALPLCLVLSTVGAVWYHWHKETEEVADPGLAMMGDGIDRAEVEDSLKKLEWLGDAGWETEEGRKQMRGVLSFVEGTLSPQNYGFVVHKGAEVSYEGELWPMVWVDVVGGEKKDEVVVVAAAYDSGSHDVVSLLTMARELKNLDPSRTIRILVFPFWLFMEHARRGDFWEAREEIVAVLSLERMAEIGGSSDARLKVGGPSLGKLEERLKSSNVDRVTHAAPQGIEQVFGEVGGAVFQMVEPADLTRGLKEKSPGNDVEALIVRTRVLAEVVRELAERE